ncbi:hypothetical protein LSH36_979g00027, partial [Paralvinella palmiformis]
KYIAPEETHLPMEIIRYIYLLFVMCYLVRGKSCQSNHCHRQQFYEFSNNTLNIEPLVPSINVPSYSCQRKMIGCAGIILPKYFYDFHNSTMVNRLIGMRVWCFFITSDKYIAPEETHLPMEIIRYIYLLFVMCYLVRGKSCQSNHCHRQQFYEFSNNTLNIEPLVPSINVPSYSCQSLQRNEKGFGMCNIYGTDIHQSDLIINDEFTVYMPCPLNFDWDVYVKKCYSTQPMGPNTWFEAVYYWDVDIWLGLYRPSTSSDVNEIRYSSDSQLVTYTEWTNGQPNNANGEENVVIASSGSHFQWFDRNGGNEARFLCEI